MTLADRGMVYKAKETMRKFEFICYACDIDDKAWEKFDKICELLTYYIAQVSFGKEADTKIYRHKYNNVLERVAQLEAGMVESSKADMNSLGYGVYSKMMDKAVKNLSLVTSQATHKTTMQKELDNLGKLFHVSFDPVVIEKCIDIAQETGYNLEGLSTPIWITLSESSEKPLDVSYVHDTDFEAQLSNSTFSM